MASVDPVLARFRAALNEIYGERLERVVLFGSRARGDARPDSDYDIALIASVAVFLKSLSDRREELHRLADLRVQFLDDTGVFFDTKAFPVTAYRDRTPIMHEIRLDGLDI